MAMGRVEGGGEGGEGAQGDLMATWAEMPRSREHVFSDRLQELLRRRFDLLRAAEGEPSLPPGRYFRMHMIGYFEGIDSERSRRVALRGLVLAARLPAAVEPGEGSRSFPAVARAVASRTRPARWCSVSC